MLLHCGAQCSIISPSIPSALIDERVRRAGARARAAGGRREGERLEKKEEASAGVSLTPTATILYTTRVL